MLKYIKAAVLALFLLGGSISYARAENAILDEKYANAGVLERLAQCESGGNPKAINPNDMGSPSFGLLQFKIKTFRAYGERYNVIQKGMSDEELRHWIMFPILQKRIADKMLSDGLYKHWLNCFKTYPLLTFRK